MMPAHLLPAFRLLCTAPNVREHEEAIMPVINWMESEGPQAGFRIPNVDERARATGRGPYLQALGLTARQLYDLIGNNFDPDAVLMRISPAVGDWLLRGAYEGPPPVPPAELMRIFLQVQAEVRQANIPAEDSPFPWDLRDPIATWGAVDGAISGRAAAERGRGGQ